MFKLEVGQELEFIQPALAGDLAIPKGTRVRVGAIMSELLDSKVTLVVHDAKLPGTLTVDRHIVTLHCQPLREPQLKQR